MVATQKLNLFLKNKYKYKKMSFKDFILSNLKLADIAPAVREEIYRIGFEDFKTAFTHKSFRSYNFKDIHELRAQQFTMDELTFSSLKDLDSFKNYDQLEFLGDKQLNVCLSELLLEDYPNLPAQHLTFAFQKISSEQYLSRFAKEHNFFPHILMSPFYYQQAIYWRDGQQEKIDISVYQKGKIFNIYDKLLEDTCESFANALVRAIDKYTKVKFTGMNFLLTWATNIMKLIDFDPNDLDETKAVGMVMKEMWEDLYAKDMKDDKITFKFANHNMFIIGEKIPGKVPIKAIDPVTKRVIAETVGVSEQDAREKASKLVVAWLKNNKMREIEEGRRYKRANAHAMTSKANKATNARTFQTNWDSDVGATSGPRDDYWW